MKTGARTFGKVGMVGAAAAAALLAGSGTASAAIALVASVPTPGVESISTVVTVTPALLFDGNVECTVTATGVGDNDVTRSATGELVPPVVGILLPAIGTIEIEDLEPGLYTVVTTCNDGGAPSTSPLSLPVTVLPEGELPPVLPPIGGGGGSLPLDIFES